MKLRNKIHLYTAVLFTVLLLLMNVSIYFLFSNLIVKSELRIAKEEIKKSAEVFNKSLGTIQETELLRAYIPIEGMIRIVKEDKKGASSVTPNEKELMKLETEYFTREVSEKFVINNHTYAFHSIPIIMPDGNLANIQITKSIETAIDNLHTLRLVLIIVTLLALIPVFISSRILSNLMVTPVRKMIETMSEIKESGHFKRLSVEEKSKDELYQMGVTFNHMIDLLETNFDKQKQFVSNASHELKTPLTIIESYASLLKRRGPADPDLFTESIEAIHSEAIRMKELTEQLLLLAKHHEQWNLQLKEVSLTNLVQQTARAFQSAYNRKIIFDEEYLPSILIETDEQKLKQLLFIFLDNARKYSDEVIFVSLGIEKQEVYIRITDQGIGIHKDELPKVFDRFYRVDKARNRKSGGSGLGLSLAKEIADAIGVRILLESEESVGTTVHLYLKIKK